MSDARIMEGHKYVAEKYPFTSAGFWWHNNRANQLVDGGASCRRISQLVNGHDPANGLADREYFFSRATAAIQTLPTGTAMPTETCPAASELIRRSLDPSVPIDWDNPRCKVSRYFTVGEVTQGDRNRIPERGSEVEANSLRLAQELDKVREAWDKPIGVPSWYRPASVNRAVG